MVTQCILKVHQIIISNHYHETLQKIHQKYITTPMFEVDENHSCIRLVTSWATSKEVCYEFVKDLEK